MTRLKSAAVLIMGYCLDEILLCFIVQERNNLLFINLDWGLTLRFIKLGLTTFDMKSL